MILVNFLLALLITEVVEVAVAYLMGYRGKYFFTILILINILTNPLLNYILTVLNYFNILGSHGFVIIILEILVILAEFRIFVYAIPVNKNVLFLLSLAINTSSYLTGLVVINMISAFA